MQVIYVAGKFRGKNQWQIVQNVRLAEEAALDLWTQGWVVICPHLNTMNFQGVLPDRVWLEGCLEILIRCDAIYMLKGWEDSVGATEELNLAKKLGLEVYYE
jgi:hypothetical protein